MKIINTPKKGPLNNYFKHYSSGSYYNFFNFLYKKIYMKTKLFKIKKNALKSEHCVRSLQGGILIWRCGTLTLCFRAKSTAPRYTNQYPSI